MLPFRDDGFGAARTIRSFFEIVMDRRNVLDVVILRDLSNVDDDLRWKGFKCAGFSRRL
jgi:hypothetical protein